MGDRRPRAALLDTRDYLIANHHMYDRCNCLQVRRAPLWSDRVALSYRVGILGSLNNPFVGRKTLAWHATYATYADPAQGSHEWVTISRYQSRVARMAYNHRILPRL